MKTKIFLTALIISIIALLSITGCKSSITSDNPNDNNQLGCTEDARICPDGSTVVRDPNNNCKFPNCANVCADDFMKCLDGSVVYRNPNKNCEFDECITECNNDFLKCPDGTQIYRDPYNNCQFPGCPDSDSELLTCNNAGGTIKEFSNGCADYCGTGDVCTAVMTTACDCGPDACWNLETNQCETE